MNDLRTIKRAMGWWLSLLVSLTGSGELAAENRTEVAGLIKSEFIFEKAAFPQCHASTIAETRRGLIVAWFGGTREKNPDVGVWISRQVPGGSWSPPREVARHKYPDYRSQ